MFEWTSATTIYALVKNYSYSCDWKDQWTFSLVSIFHFQWRMKIFKHSLSRLLRADSLILKCKLNQWQFLTLNILLYPHYNNRNFASRSANIIYYYIKNVLLFAMENDTKSRSVSDKDAIMRHPWVCVEGD